MLYTPDLLLEKIKLGDKQAEQALVQKYYKNLQYILFQRSSDHELANDLAQEAFIVVINKARNGQIENPSALGAFIRNVGVNLLIAHYRKETRHKTDTAEDIDIQFGEASPLLHEQLNSKKVGELVMQMVKELPTDRDRELLLRYFAYGHEKHEVCEALELSTAHFDRVLHRARNRLKQILHLKCDAEIGELGISHLLTAALLTLPVSISEPAETHFNEINVTTVREILRTSHLIATKEKAVSRLNNQRLLSEAEV